MVASASKMKLRKSVSVFGFVVCCLLVGNPVGGNGIEDTGENYSDVYTTGNSESTESSLEGNKSPEPHEPLQISPSNSLPLSTYFVTATLGGMPQYPIDFPQNPPFTTEYPPQMESMDSQLIQPDFFPGDMDDNFSTGESEDAGSYSPPPQEVIENQSIQTTQVPVEDSTMTDFLGLDTEVIPEVTNELRFDSERVNDSDGQVEDDTELVAEPIPTPMALISSNGEGSNPPLEEEFAEAFKRVGPNGRRRRIRPGGGRRRVRMRVRKSRVNNTNTTESPDEERLEQATENYDEMNPSTPTNRLRRYRSTTPSPDPSPPTIPQSVRATSSVVNGPKPIIISDIHSGSTGLNSVNSVQEPQLEKPISGGYTEKISTYFITPPSRISTTNAPKAESGENSDLKPVESSQRNQFAIKRNPWDTSEDKFGNSVQPEGNATPDPKIESVETSESLKNSVKAPMMEDRLYNVNGGLTGGNNFGPSEPSPNMFDNPYNQEAQNSSNANSGPSPGFFSNPPYDGFDESGPSSGPNGVSDYPTRSHYDRSRDPFFNTNQFFKENNPFPMNEQGAGPNGPNPGSDYQSTGPQSGPPSGPARLPENNQISLPIFDENGYISTTPPTGEQFYPQNNPDEFQNLNVDNNDYGKSTHYSTGVFKGAPNDPLSNGQGPRNLNTQLQRPLHFPSPGYQYDNSQNPSNFPSRPEPQAPNMYLPPQHQTGEGPGYSGPSPPNGSPVYTQNIEGSVINPIEYPQTNELTSGNGGEYPTNIKLTQNSFNTNPSGNQEASGGNDKFNQPQNEAPNAVPTGPVFGIVEDVPLHNNQNEQNNPNSQRFPVFIATSPGESGRTPTFSSNRPMRPNFHHRPHPPFFRNNMHPMHGPRYPLRHQPNTPLLFGINGPSNNFGNYPHLVPSGRPPPNFQNDSPHVNLPMPGLNNIPPPPTEEQALSEVRPTHNFPPHTHSMSDKPDYEPANPPLPPGHPLENNFGNFPNVDDVSNHLDGNMIQNYQDPSTPTQLDTPNSQSSLASLMNTHEPNHDRPGFDILSAYYDKPPPTVSSDYGHHPNMPPMQNIHNDLSKVPFQYSSSDGGGLDSGPYYHTPDSEPNTEKPKTPKPNYDTETPVKAENGWTEEKNVTAMYSETPYVLMFPQLVPEEAMVPPPPKLMTKEIPVVQASSLSTMKYTLDGKPVKPVLGPGLKAVVVHPRHQMYQVLAKAHYDKALQKYMEARKKPPSAIYTPYGVLVPMGPSAAASTNQESYGRIEESHQQNQYHKDPHDKQLLNLLLGKKSPLGHFHLFKQASLKNGRLKKHFDFKANIDPALDLLAEKLAIKLSAAKYILSAPAKLGVHAFTKHSTSYSENQPVVQSLSNLKEEGKHYSMNFGSELQEILAASQAHHEAKKAKGEEVDPHLKRELKRLLKERLREILEESDEGSRGRMTAMESSLINTRVPHPNSNSNKWTNYFASSQPNGGLLGTIKRLFSFGESKSGNNDRSDSTLGNDVTSTNSNSSSHPFSYGGLNLFNSIGRMGQPSGPVHSQPKGLPELGRKVSTPKTQRKVKKQLEKWLDIVLKSSDKVASSSKTQPLFEKYPLALRNEKNGRTGKSLGKGDSMFSNVKSSSPQHKSSLSSLSLSNNLDLAKKPSSSGYSSNFLSSSWTPIVSSAFRSVFNYPPAKSPTVLKPKTV